MPSDLKADLQRLVELRDKAEPGPWSNQFHRAEVRRNKTLVADCRKSPSGFAKGHCDGDFITACGNTDFAAVLERLESLEAENQRLRECLPSPDMMSGWDDPGAPDDVLVEIGAVCSLRGVEMPDHVREAWRRRGETD